MITNKPLFVTRYLKVLFDLLFAFLSKGWKRGILNLDPMDQPRTPDSSKNNKLVRIHTLDHSTIEKAINVYPKVR